MEGQDVARLATAGGITDSYVEQGLEAELSVDLYSKNAAGNSDGGPESLDASQHDDQGNRIPRGARKGDGSER